MTGIRAQLPREIEAYWQEQTFTDLRAAQGTTGRVDPAELEISDLTDDERVAFLTALAD